MPKFVLLPLGMHWAFKWNNSETTKHFKVKTSIVCLHRKQNYKKCVCKCLRISRNDQNHEKTTYYSMSSFHDFEELQKMMEIMKKQPTIAHGLETHTIACVFHDF